MAMAYYVRFDLIGDDTFTHVLCQGGTVRSVISLSMESQYEQEVLYFTEEDVKQVVGMFAPFAASDEAVVFADDLGLVELARVLYKTPASVATVSSGGGGGVVGGSGGGVAGATASGGGGGEGGGGEGGSSGEVATASSGGVVAPPAEPAAMPVSIHKMWSVSYRDALGNKPLVQPSVVTDEVVSNVMRSLFKKVFPSSSSR